MYGKGNSQFIKIPSDSYKSNSSSSEDTYYTASPGTSSEGSSSHCVSRIRLSNIRKAEENASESEDSDISEQTIANTFISDGDKSQAFELDNIYDQDLLRDTESADLEFNIGVGPWDEYDLDQTSVPVSDSDVRINQSPSNNLQIGSVENERAYIVSAHTDESFTSEEIIDGFRSETIRENKEEILKMLQEKINRSENVWSYKIFAVESEAESKRSTSLTSTDYLSDFVDEIEGNAGGNSMKRSEMDNNSDVLPECEREIVRTSSLQRLVLSTTLKTLKTSKKVSLSSQEDDKKTFEHCVFKILVNGRSGAGKTSIIKRFTKDLFRQHCLSNGSVDMYVKVMYWNETILLQLNLWDIPADKEIDYLKYKDAYGSFIIHDVLRSDTLRSIKRWKKFIDKNVLLPNGDPIPCVLLANKIDLQEGDEMGSLIDINAYCEKLKISAWYVTSAREGTNIERAFNYLISQMLQNKTTYYKSDTVIQHKLKKRRKLCHESCCVN